MTRPVADVQRVAELIWSGVSEAETARRTGVPRGTLRRWTRIGLEEAIERRMARLTRSQPGPCLERPCPRQEHVVPDAYAYLLGMYLGDGSIATLPRGVFKLRITLNLSYPRIIAECEDAMVKVLPNRVGRARKIGCLDLQSHSKHWPCLFPQQGPGRKHLRSIVLERWQKLIALEDHPEVLLRGLVHSDGCRVLNRVNGTAYPRYHFSNRSDDIRAIFAEACRRLGIACRPNSRWELSVARRDSVAKLDEFIGPKS